MLTKTCTKCDRTLLLSDYHKNRSTKDGVQTYCKQCNIALRIDYYKRNSDKEKDYDRDRKLQISKRLWEFLENNPCVDCGESDPRVLEFDHVKGKKKFNLGGCRSYAWKTVQKEITKCQVRCANCHRRKTALELGWYKWAISKMESR